MIFKEIAHCILPRPVQSDDFVDIDELVEFDLMLCYRNVMDLLIEDGYGSVVFTHPLLYMDKTSVVSLAVSVLSYWMEFSVYAEKVWLRGMSNFRVWPFWVGIQIFKIEN